MSNKLGSVKAISERLGEPFFLLDVRLKALSDSSEAKPYGLGISAKAPSEGFSALENSVQYEYGENNTPTILSWKEAIIDEQILPYLKNIFSEVKFSDREFAESFANFGGGLVVFAVEGSEVSFEMTSQLLNSGSGTLVCIAEKNATLKIFHQVKGSTPVSFGSNVFTFVGDNARMVFVESLDVAHGGSYFSHKASNVSSDARMEWYDLLTNAENVRSFTEDILQGKGAESFTHHLSLCSESHFDIYNTVRHNADHTSSHISARGIAGGSGKIIYRALSTIAEGTIGTTGRQDGRFLVTGSGAEVDAIPSLDIASAESSSSHSLSISHLSDKDFFYPALRGISPYTAQAMLLSGFLMKSIDTLPDNWKNILSENIHKKLSSKLFFFD